MRLLVIQHAACEPGAYEAELRGRDIAFERVQIDRGEPLHRPGA